MFKKIICFFVISIVAFHTVGVTAENPHLEQDDNLKGITRGECIIEVMKVIGVNQAAADLAANADYDQPVFKDVNEKDFCYGYSIIARYCDVVMGTINNETGCYFEPNRSVTTKECLTFMLRCLRDYQMVDWDNIGLLSEEIGLLNKEEVDLITPDELLTADRFHILLERMLLMRRYLYWQETEREEFPGLGEVQIDQEGSVRYIETKGAILDRE